MIRVIVKCGGETRELTLTDTESVIGRAAECQIKITDLKSSRRHAKIQKVDNAYHVVDLESGNGTRVNGQSVGSFVLAKGDAIQIGETTITVTEMDVPDPARAPVDVVEKAPVPVEKKLDVKNKIEGVKKAISEAREAAVEPVHQKILKKLAGAAALIIAAIGVYLLVMAVKDNHATRLTDNARKAPEKQPGAVTFEEAEKAFASFKQKADAAPRVTDELLAEGQALSTKYYDVYRAKVGDTQMTPFDQLVQTLVTRRAELFAALFADVSTKVDDAIRARRYGEAIGVLAEFRKTADSSYEDSVRSKVELIEAQIDEDWKAVVARGESLEGAARFADAALHWRIHGSRFLGTRHYLAIEGKPEALLEQAKLAELARNRPAKDPVTPAKDPVTPTKDPVPVTPAKPVEVSGLAALLVEPINAGKLTGRTFKFADDKRAMPLSADKEKVTVKVGDTQEQVVWGGVPASAIFEMAKTVLRDDDLLAVAAYGYQNGLAAEADKLLERYVSADRKERQPKADEVLARARGLRSVPDGGYTWDAKLGWEDKAQKDNRLAREEGEKLAKDLANAKDLKKVDSALARLSEWAGNPAIAQPVRDSIKIATVDALKANKAARLKDIQTKARTAAGFDAVRAAKLELNKRREEALKVIYDVKIYLPENHPDWNKGDKINGQAEVDRLVDRVKELWKSAGSYMAALNPTVKHDIEMVQAINEKYLPAMGESVGEDDLKDFEEVMANLDRNINLKSFSLNSRESDIYKWNRSCEKYNEALKDDGVTQGIKVHCKVVNDYREMMGRRQCVVDGRLCKATTKHSAACNAAGRIWHVGSDGDPQSRAKAEGFTAGVGENVAIGYADGADIWWRGWYRASDHHRNGLSDAWNCMGYGYVGSVGTQNFSNIAAPKGF
jgi:hypothetical protein